MRWVRMNLKSISTRKSHLTLRNMRRESKLLKNMKSVSRRTMKSLRKEKAHGLKRSMSFLIFLMMSFKKERTGALNGKGRGLLKPDPEKMVDADSELFFAAVRMTRGSAPDSYSSVDEGLVSGVKNQNTCGSCV